MISLLRSYHRRFGHNERYHLAVVFTILVVAWVAVPLVVQFVDAVRGYDPAYYEPKDFERQDWLKRQVVIDIVLVLPVAIVWLTFVPARGPRRHSPPR